MDTSITGYNIMSTDKDISENMSARAQDWMVFAKEVTDHVECYTVPQYGDFPNDQLTKFNLLDIKAQLTRYVNRIGSGVRGKEEAERDMLKLAHYAGVAYMKMRNEEGQAAGTPDNVEIFVSPNMIVKSADSDSIMVNINPNMSQVVTTNGVGYAAAA